MGSQLVVILKLCYKAIHCNLAFKVLYWCLLSFKQSERFCRLNLFLNTTATQAVIYPCSPKSPEMIAAKAIEGSLLNLLIAANMYPPRELKLENSYSEPICSASTLLITISIFFWDFSFFPFYSNEAHVLCDARRLKDTDKEKLNMRPATWGLPNNWVQILNQGAIRTNGFSGLSGLKSYL